MLIKVMSKEQYSTVTPHTKIFDGVSEVEQNSKMNKARTVVETTVIIKFRTNESHESYTYTNSLNIKKRKCVGWDIYIYTDEGKFLEQIA